MALLCALLACTLVGHLVDRVVLDDPSTTWIERLGRALMFGLGTLGTLSMLLDVVGLGVSLATVGGSAAALAVGLLGFQRFRRPRPIAPRPAVEPMTPREHVVHALLLLFGAAGLFLAVRSGWIRPTFQFDALLRWMFKAKVLYHEGTLMGPVSTDTYYAVTHQRYPPLVSHVAVMPALGAARFDDRITSAIFPWFAVALAAVVYGALARSVGRLTGALAVAWLGQLPLVSYLLAMPPGAGASSAMADIPLALFVTGAVLVAGDVVAGRRPRALLEAGLLAGFATLTKNEGGPFVVALGLGLVLTSSVHRWRRAGVVVGCALAMFLAAWWSVAYAFPAEDEDYLGQLGNTDAVVTGIERVGPILSRMGADLVSFRLWNVTWVAAAALLIAGGRAGLRRRDVRLALFVIGFQLAAYAYAFMITQWTSPAGEAHSQGEDTLPFLMTLTMGRLLLHVAPLAIIAGLLVAPLSLRRSG